MDGLIYELSRGIISGLISLGSLFYSSISGVDPVFSEIEYNISGKSIFISTRLDNYSTPELDAVFRSGLPIRLIFTITAATIPGSDPASNEISFWHELTFDPLEEEFRILFNETGKLLRIQNMVKAKYLFTQLHDIHLPLPDMEDKWNNLIITVKVNPSRITLEELQQELDLLPYWNMTRPEVSVSIPRNEFRQ